MCYICSCFTWTLDLLQRILTFFLSCWLVCSVCCGLSIATIAGVAYGYNYCFAEFIVHARPDVKVYMRRGQFYDKPDNMLVHHRRSDKEDDAFAANLTEEYQQEAPPGDDSLAEQWEKERDTSKYAEKLTKYSNSKNNIVNAEQSDINHKEDHSDSLYWEKSQDTPRYSIGKAIFNADHRDPEVNGNNYYYKLTMPPARRVSILPNPIILTTVIQSGSSEIVMRKFEPGPNFFPEP
ncbi:uncharacterized protein, partial [Maniola hyperantus]|uniref:uncharacterized protein n=1 Tax=Aphantopus hyperantus TaxID=2795564 RepID=UPI0037484E26